MTTKQSKLKAIGRRQFIGTTAATAALAATTARASAPAPNVILITADDLGWRELGCYGNPHIQTPNLDRLAEQGVRFTNAFVAAPSCSASRSAIITGQIPHSIHVLGLTHQHPQYQLSPDVPTLPRELLGAGYNTGIQGKWHVAPYKPTRLYGYQTQMSLFNQIKRSHKARHFIKANKKRPFYLELNFFQPHRPAGHDHVFQQHPDFPVDPDAICVPEYWRIPDWPEIRTDVAAYYSQTAWMDHLIGEIMDELDQQGLTENTIVAFVSDNGPPYPGCKTTCYDPGIGTPMILRWPDGLPAGAVVDGLASTMDLMPTCLEAAGLPTPATVQGDSLLGMARGETAEVHEEIFAEVTYHVIYTPMRAIRTHDFKYVENLSPDPTGLDQCKNHDWAQRVAKLPGQTCCVLRPPEELFDLKADPLEKNNLAQKPEFTAVKQKLSHRLHQWREQTNDPFPDLS